MQPNDSGFHKEDRDLLIRMSERVAAIESNVAKMNKAIHGNGQPGLITRMARVETRLIIITSVVLASAVAGAATGYL